jgi:hypothetical protein
MAVTSKGLGRFDSSRDVLRTLTWRPYARDEWTCAQSVPQAPPVESRGDMHEARGASACSSIATTAVRCCNRGSQVAATLAYGTTRPPVTMRTIIGSQHLRSRVYTCRSS